MWSLPQPTLPVSPTVTGTAPATGMVPFTPTVTLLPWPAPKLVTPSELAKLCCTWVPALNSVVPVPPRWSLRSSRTASIRTVVRPCRTTIASPAVMALSRACSLIGVSSSVSLRTMPSRSFPNGLSRPRSSWCRTDSPRDSALRAGRSAPGVSSWIAYTSLTIVEESSRRWSRKPAGCLVVAVGAASPSTGRASRRGTATRALPSTWSRKVPSCRPSRVNLTSTSYLVAVSKKTAGSVCFPRLDTEAMVSAAPP